ncbi:MAG TPA: YbiU family protein [Anaeromyxobacter sp.]|nr:YbiU family protein [Anaeromyxobacter sp.]
MQPWMNDVPATVVRVKAELRQRVPDAEARFRTLSAQLEREVNAVREEARAGGAVPELHFSDLAAGDVPGELAERIRRRGCAVVRGVFPASRIASWNDQIGEYVERNRYIEKQKSRAGLDRYFATLAAASPQIFSLYWSKAQVSARQSDELARVRAALNRLWHQPSAQAPAFDAARECTYADRLRRRQPGDKTLGLSPHADGGSVERWCDPSYQRVYGEVLFGDPTRYDPFDATHRVRTEEIPSPAVCSVFRTFQGWTALSQQGPGDGTLQLIPIANLMGWILLRALQPDVAGDDLCGAKAGKALPFDPRWHGAAAEALVSIPRVQSGDTVFWHNDLIHAVESEHKGKASSNVIYIGAVPLCEKNAAFLPRQAEAFRQGKSCPDFAPENYEVDFEGRAVEEDLTPLGRRQMGIEPW